MIKHLVFFKFKPEVDEAERSKFFALLKELPAKIEVIREFEVGMDIVKSPRSFDIALISSFDDLSALGVYAKHPGHLPVVERAKLLCEQIAAVDYEV